MPKTAQPLFDPDRFYSAATIAEILDVPRAGRINRWIREGRFPDGAVVELPEGRRVRGSALNAWLTDNTLRQ